MDNKDKIRKNKEARERTDVEEMIDLYKVYTAGGREFIINPDIKESQMKRRMDDGGIIKGQEFKEQGLDPSNYEYRRDGAITLNTENLVGLKYYETIQRQQP